MRHVRIIFLSIFLLSLFATAQAPKPILKIDGKIAAPITITADDWAKLPRATVMATRGHSKDKVQYEGVPLKVLLEKAGVINPAKIPHRKELLQYVLITASDGYQALFSIAELDEATGATTGVLLADKVEGKPLEANEAPLKLVVPSDKRPERFVRMITTITIGSVAN
jgi:hypothetical protein